MSDKENEKVQDVESARNGDAETKASTVAENAHETTTQTNGKKHFHLGEYDISVPNEKVPLVGVMASALVLIAALAVDEIIDSNRKRGAYGFVLGIVAFICAFISLIVSSKGKFNMYLTSFIFVWCFIGACIMTFRPGPYVNTGNGYFASWGLVIFAGIAADPPGELTRGLLDSLNDIMDLGAAALVFMIALATEFDAGLNKYEGEAIYAIVIAVLTIVFILVMTLYKYKNPDVTISFESILMFHIAVAWIIAAILVTFRGPFSITGNGYFVAWIGTLLACRASASSWRASKK
jgi:phosphatidylserine synthase